MSALEDGEVAAKESEFADAFNTGQDYLAHRGRLGDFYWVMNDNKFKKACETCHRFVDSAVSQALEDSKVNVDKEDEVDDKKNYVFLDALIQETQDPKVLRDQCLNLLLAGRDTTACCISWTLYVSTFDVSLLKLIVTR